jgi:pimeloyl-ACP methyl ester carboxylesterase
MHPTLAGASHRFLDADGVRLHGVELGRGPLVLLLHGFPESWWTWRAQLPALADAGFRAVALDLRGYGASERPRGPAAYGMDALVGDVAHAIRALDADRAHLVGHDWGGVVAWEVAARRPELVARLAIVNAPHPAAFLRGLARGGQALRSAYLLLFQLPALPERLFRLRRRALHRAALRAFRATPVADAELEPFLASAAADDLAGGFAYYRALARGLVVPGSSRAPRGGRVDAPTLVLWGERDPVLAPHLAEPPRDLVPDLRVVRLARASHDAHQDAAAEVNRALVAFLRAGAPVGVAPASPRREGRP